MGSSGVDLTFAAHPITGSPGEMSNPKLHQKVIFASRAFDSNIRKRDRSGGMRMLESGILRPMTALQACGARHDVRLHPTWTNVAKMTMTVALFRRILTLILGGSMTLVLMAATAPPAHAQVVVMVNGEPITNFDIEQRSKLLMLSTHKQPDRQQVINELIDEKVKIREGKKFSIDPSANDVDQSYAAMSNRMRITPEALTKSLEGAGVRPDTLKARIKADLVWSNLIRGRYKESLQI